MAAVLCIRLLRDLGRDRDGADDSPGRPAGGLRSFMSGSISPSAWAWPSGCTSVLERLAGALLQCPPTGTCSQADLARRAELRRAVRCDLHGVRGPASGRGGARSASCILVRGRRLYSIARLSIYESNRKMWAPWVVVTVFLLVLAFTHWFLQPPRAAEMGRLYVGTLSLLCSILLTVMVTIMTPLSLPTDIQQQTIYTVVSKPVRRIELIWGRMIGYMAIVTVLVLASAASACSTCRRTVGGTLQATEQAADKAKKENRLDRLTSMLLEQADQLRARMQARVPIKGSLSFLDSRGTPQADRNRRRLGTVDERAAKPHRGGDSVGGDLEVRPHGAGPVLAAGAASNYLNRRIPVEDFILPGTIEWELDRVYELAEPD